jgi:two-component system, OmpR family, sensor histidine kinase KdpD
MSTCQLARAARPQFRAPIRISDVRGQDRVTLVGTVISVQVIAVGSSTACRCVLADSTGELDLIFLGRTAIAGLVAGIRCTIHGVVAERGDRLAIWNPRWRVLPAEDSAEGSRLDQPADGTAAEPPGPDRAAARVPVPATGPPVPVMTGHSEIAGQLRIYLAAAAGAGKTVAMLDEGHRLRSEGAEVVIAFVEDHDRPATQAHSANLEIVPRRAQEYHSARFEEMDLDGVLRRNPGVALVDELAHTNVPGSGLNAKRWQDVLDLLNAGIDVITTVNIQHLESVAPAVEQITHMPVRERVPDSIVRRASQIEFVDSSPGQLRHRLLQGEVYPAGQVSQALTHFFRADNLTELRQVTLRFLADDEEEFASYLARLRSRARKDAAERMLVGVTFLPCAEAVVRRAARIAAGIEADLDVVHVTSHDPLPGHHGGDDGLAPLRRTVADVGATWHYLNGDDVVSTLVEYAKDEQITQIVVGSSQRSRWRELIGGGSIVGRVSRLAAEAGIDVHIVAPHQACVREG